MGLGRLLGVGPKLNPGQKAAKLKADLDEMARIEAARKKRAEERYPDAPKTTGSSRRGI